MRYFFYALFIISFACPPLAADTAQTLNKLKNRYEVDSCIGCHEENGQQWSESRHAQSLADPRVLKSINMYIEANAGSGQTAGIQVLEECLSCHAPQKADASDDLLRSISELIATAVGSLDKKKRKSAFKDLSHLDVNCRVCHMIRGMLQNEVQPDTIYGSGWDEDEISHKREYGYETVGSDHLMSSSLCISCHRSGDSSNPALTLMKFQSEIIKHYTETNSKEACQDCHMRKNGTTSHTFRYTHPK